MNFFAQLVHTLFRVEESLIFMCVGVKGQVPANPHSILSNNWFWQWKKIVPL